MALTLSQPTGLAPDLHDDAAGLVDSLATLHAALGRLHAVSVEKLAAMRRADVAGLARLAVEESAPLGEALQARDAQRAILARLAQRLRPTGAPPAGVAEMVDFFPEPRASQIRARIAGLQETAGKLSKQNALVASVARGMQTHIAAVLEEIANANCQPVGYGPNGRVEQQVTRNWIDAVG